MTNNKGLRTTDNGRLLLRLAFEPTLAHGPSFDAGVRHFRNAVDGLGFAAESELDVHGLSCAPHAKLRYLARPLSRKLVGREPRFGAAVHRREGVPALGA